MKFIASAIVSKEGLSVPVANGFTLAAVNLADAKDWTMYVAQLALVIGTVIFTYFKIRKMRAEALRAEQRVDYPSNHRPVNNAGEDAE